MLCKPNRLQMSLEVSSGKKGISTPSLGTDVRLFCTAYCLLRVISFWKR